MDLETGRIGEVCLHVDVLGVMHQAGHYPLPPPTGVMLNPVPGPLTHDGILTRPQDEEETAKTYQLLEEHVAGKIFLPLAKFCGKFHPFLHFLRAKLTCQPADEVKSSDRHATDHAKSDAAALAVPTWHPDMLWYGPGGIGSTGLTVSRYQRQHQLPFRKSLYDKETVYTEILFLHELSKEPSGDNYRKVGPSPGEPRLGGF